MLSLILDLTDSKHLKILDFNILMSKDLFFYNTSQNGSHPKVIYNTSRNVLNKIKVWENILIKKHWNLVKQPLLFNGDSCCLWEASKEKLIYIGMPFMVYNTVSYFQEREICDIFTKKTMKIVHALALGCCIESSDGIILVQERGKGLLAEGKLDASSTGVANIRGKEINLEKIMLRKIKEELNLRKEDLEPLIFTGNHEPCDYPSSMCTFKTKTNKEFRKINGERNKNRVPKLYGIPKNELPGFLIDHYVGEAEPQIIGDGIATLMRSLEPEQFKEVIKELRKKGVNIKFGIVKNRKFFEDELKSSWHKYL